MAGRIQLERFMGRWGNCVGQWAVARSAAHRLGCVLETPPWMGRGVFGLNDPIRTPRFPRLPAEALPDRPNLCCHGYWQNQAAFDLMSRSQLRGWLRVRPGLLAMCPKPRPFYVACHIRMGDYVTHHDKFAAIQRPAFERAVVRFGYDLKDVIWLTEETPQPGSARLAKPVRFLYDFMVLMQADVVFRANSTFSQWAAILGNSDRHYSPVVGDKVGVRDDIEFVEGNSEATISMLHHPSVPHSGMVLAP